MIGAILRFSHCPDWVVHRLGRWTQAELEEVYDRADDEWLRLRDCFDEPPPPPDRHAIQCNLTTAQSAAAKGARAYVVRTNPGWGHDRIVVLLRSRSGRWIEKWQDIRTLANFRVKTIPAEHQMYGDDRVTGIYEPEATAAKLNEAHDYWQENRR